MPDLVFFLKIDPSAGLERAGTDHDRVESAGSDFHQKVAAAYLDLAARFPQRIVVLDASKPKEQVHEEILRAYGERAGKHYPEATLARDFAPPGPPMPR
jgi:dTMP kinase